MMDLRLLLAATVLVPVVAIRLGVKGAAAEIRATGRGAFILGVTNMAFPFVLIAWGEKHIDSGVAAIADATAPIFVTTASVLAASLVLLPFALAHLPDEMPSWKALGAVAALGIAGTPLALLFFYAMLNRYGASRASLVTYLLPPFALFYGVLFLDEWMTLNAVLGLLLILAGVALGSGFMQLARRRAAAPSTPRT